MANSLIAQADLHGKTIDVGSDWHLDLQQTDIVGRAVNHIKNNRKSEVLFCMGDLFNTPNGENSSGAIREFLEGISGSYDHVIFTPGNHDLRGRENPWTDFENLSGNIVVPHPENVVIWEQGGIRVLVGNVFYDMEFIDPESVGISHEEVKQQYAASNDGKHFLHGETHLFKEMTQHAANCLQPDIDAIATHALPHPSLVTFRVDQVDDEIKRVATATGLDFICNPKEDREQATRWNSTPAEFRKWWNIKSIFMGSNVIGHASAQPRDGLLAIHGHHHRNDLRLRNCNGKTFRPITHQMNQDNPKLKIIL